MLILFCGGDVSELALYRKYRSKDFDEVLGQNHIVTILRAQIAADKVGHAYLFTGPKGVGKTSVARLLARSANCTGDTKPCGTCPNCQVALASHMDVIEIDAASNRGIDEIRALREKINSAPSQGSHKIYIIDEVHMLTEGAFNALLKTLEEPPSHAIFVLATTEAHKIPDTIISRTQRFNFRPISNDDLILRLESIAAAENIHIDRPAIELLAAAGRGGFRDAISLLDQVAMLGQDDEITAETVRELLGWADGGDIQTLAATIAAGQAAEALATLDKLIASGTAIGQIVTQLTAELRAAMRQAADPAADQPSAGVDRLATTIDALLRVGKSSWPEVALEATIIRLASLRNAPQPSIEPVAPPPAAASPSATTPPPAPTAVVSADDNSDLNPELWPKVLLLVQDQNRSLYALLCSCSVNIGDNGVVIESKFSFHRDRLNEPKNRQVIETALAKVYGHPVPIVAQVASPTTKPAVDSKTELVSSALEILGGEVVDE